MKATVFRKKWRARGASALAALAFALVAGACGRGADPTGTEVRGRPMAMAAQAEEAQDWQKAADWYELALRRRPEMALAHRKLAVLFQTRLQNVPAALYHYQKFLELAPEATDREEVQEQIDNCIQYIAERANGDPSGLSWQVDELRSQITVADRNLVAAQAENRQLREQLAAALTGRTPPPAQGGPALRAPVSPVPASRPAPAGPLKYTVRAGENLGKIAQRHGTTVDAIIKANPGVIPGNDPRRLQVGTELTIPASTTR